jgi:sugar lactone lactonase YvrE
MKSKNFFALLLVSVLSASQPAVWASETTAPEAGEVSAAETAVTEEAPMVETVTGTGSHGASNEEKRIQFNLPGALTGDGKSLYIADTYNNLIREFNQSGQVKTYTGRITGMDENRFPRGLYRDGNIKTALFNRPNGIAQGGGGRLYVTDSLNNSVRVVTRNKVTTIAGNSTAGYKDGKGTDAMFNAPSGIAVDSRNNLYVADTLNHVIRKISANGTVTTIAGTAGEAGYMDASVKRALFNSPMGIAVSEDGTIYVADTGNHRIRVIRGNRVTTLAGTVAQIDQDGEPWGDFLDGPGDAAMFNIPIGIALYEGNIIVADSGNNRIRLVSISGGDVITLAGTGEPGGQNGALLDATFNLPSGLYAHDDVLYIADTGNNQIRKLPLKGIKAGETNPAGGN